MNAKYPDGHTMSPTMSQTHLDLHTLPEFWEAMESLYYQTWTEWLQAAWLWNELWKVTVHTRNFNLLQHAD